MPKTFQVGSEADPRDLEIRFFKADKAYDLINLLNPKPSILK